jgi:nicotinate-nucleotide adenylyltransferase
LSPTVAIFGGSFDPVHAAHLEVARRARDQIPCDEVWFLPAARAVHKPSGAHASAADRRAMLELAVEGERGLVICDLELDHGKPRRSVDSLTELSGRWPDHQWWFVLGEDSFRELDRWYRPEDLFRIAHPVVAPRPGSRGERTSIWRGHEVRWLSGGEIDLDSTALRRALSRGENPEGLDSRVLGYIREHGLYREQQG